MHFTMSLVVYLYESEHIFTSAIKDHKDFPYKILPSLPSFFNRNKQIEKCIKITFYPFFTPPTKNHFITQLHVLILYPLKEKPL